MSEFTPKAGDYGVVKTKGIVPLLIRIGTLSHWNHAFIYIGDGLIVEANPKGVEVSPVTKYKHIVWNRNDKITKKQREEIVFWAKDQVGTPYSFLTIALIAFRILGFRLLSKWAKFKKLAEQEGYICSELVAESYKNVGINTGPKPDYLTTPADLVDRLLYL